MTSRKSLLMSLTASALFALTGCSGDELSSGQSGSAGGGGQTGGQTGGGQSGGGSEPPVATVPTSYPKDGFCDEAGSSWAWCEDFDGQGASAPATFAAENAGISFHSHGHMKMTGTPCETSGDCTPYVQGGSLFLNPEDSGFGMNVLRIEQPFDFAGREGHVHYRSNMKGHPRMHQTVHIGPVVSNTLPDLRFTTVLEAVNAGPAIDFDFIGDGGWPFEITVWKDGQKSQQFHVQGPVGIPHGTGESLFDVDFYVSRTRVRVALNGVQVLDQALADIGFDRGYVHFAQLAYNPVKDGYVGDAGNRFQWDNLAFDGPSLPANSLTPADKQDILFRAFDKGSCTVRGVAADGPINPTHNWIFDTWHVRIGVNDAPITLSDIVCITNKGLLPLYGQTDIGDIQVVKR
jgi:hypothetical protein